LHLRFLLELRQAIGERGLLREGVVGLGAEHDGVGAAVPGHEERPAGLPDLEDVLPQVLPVLAEVVMSWLRDMASPPLSTRCCM